MKERAILSSEMPSILNGLYRNVPSAVKISAVLCRDERFVKLEKPYCYGLSGAKSHRVILLVVLTENMMMRPHSISKECVKHWVFILSTFEEGVGRHRFRYPYVKV